MKTLLPHQKKYAKGYKDKAFLVHEGGTGKTICACAWLKDERDDDALVVCPKRVVKKWQETLTEWGTKATVLSKDDFKKHPLKKWSAIVLDEADEFAAPLFVRSKKKRSQISTKTYELIRLYNVPTMLLTATPIRSTPWNLHTLLCYLYIYIDHKVFREEYFFLDKAPFLQHMAYFPVKDWREKIVTLLEKHADIVLLRECVKYLPPVEEIKIKMPVIPMTENKELGSSARFIARHKHEQKEKHKEILSIAKDFRKVLVVAYYREQIDELKKHLEKDRQTFVVHGAVKNQEDILKQANEKSDECFLIVQASIGAGFDADTFSCVIFASMSYMVRDFVQMKFRVRRIHNLHPVKYYYLIAGKCDRNVQRVINLGKDFVPSEYKYDEDE